MNDVEPGASSSRADNGRSPVIDLSDLPVVPHEHFKLSWFGTIIQVARCALAALGTGEAVVRDFPFIGEYAAQLTGRRLDWTDPDAARRWWASIEAWERGTSAHLPLRSLRLAVPGGWNTVGALLTAGLQEDDPRFGALFAALQGGSTAAPTVGFVNACWNDGNTSAVRTLQEWGLIHVAPGNAARSTWTLQVPAWVWDAATEGPARASGSGWKFEPVGRDGSEPELVVSEPAQRALTALPDLVRQGAVGCVVVRGPRGSGRTRFTRELARQLGRGLLTFSPALKQDDERWSMLMPLCTLLGALPVAEFELAPGESVRIPELGDCPRPLAITLGRSGGVIGAGAENPVTLELGVPPHAARTALFACVVPGAGAALHALLATRHRMPAGRLVQLASHAAARAALDRRAPPSATDFEAAARAMHADEIGSLAAPTPPGGSWADLALPDDVLVELHALESRCRHRERMADEQHPFAPNVGVRALLTGPSGTGKTLSARVLGTALGRDVYRVDLAAVVSKYIGETERNLERVLALAEELDVVLLFDEGDALLARRTAVQTSNDRYANLETNFLLQRLEAFEGIVFITTNAGDRIDPAFQRRMDAIIEFRMPELAERRRLWQLHLPAQHAVDPLLLDRLAGQCSLSGGQIRNASLHARLLALDLGAIVNDDLLAESVRREYRKLGAACPLRLP